MSAIVQGSDAWHALRKTKITATDAACILGVSPWKSALQLYEEKVSTTVPTFKSDKMQRGLDLEPIARELFSIKTGLIVQPDVVFSHNFDWQMASLDGIDVTKSHIVEIKCPNPKDHAAAVAGKIPEHYYPQLQHQMSVCDVENMYYFSFDGIDGVIVEVERDDAYIEKMIEAEKKFYDCMINGTPPNSQKNKYQERNDDLWQQYALKWKTLTTSIKSLQEEEFFVREKLIELSGGLNTKGEGINLCKIQRKGNIDFSLISELKHIDLEKYRKPSLTTWRISQD